MIRKSSLVSAFIYPFILLVCVLMGSLLLQCWLIEILNL